MLESLLAILLISGIIMCGIRRIKTIQYSFVIQSLCIAVICFLFGYTKQQNHYYIMCILIIITKVILVPIMMKKVLKNIKSNREMKPILSGHFSYILISIGIICTYYLLRNYTNPIPKAGIVIMLVGTMLLMARKNIVTQMFGFLTMENGFVLFEVFIVEMILSIEIGIIAEVLLLTAVMGMMILSINKILDTVNTDHLSNLKG